MRRILARLIWLLIWLLVATVAACLLWIVLHEVAGRAPLLYRPRALL